MNIISSFNDMKMYGGATISGDRLICASSGQYASIRIPVDPLSEINVSCMIKVTGALADAGIFVQHPDTSVTVTSIKGIDNDWAEIQLSYTVPATDLSGYVEVAFGSKTTGACFMYKPVISISKGSRYAAGLMAGGLVVVSGGAVSFNTSTVKFGFESVAINPSMLWLDVTMAKGFQSPSSTLYPVVMATPESNAAASYVKIAAGNFGGVENKTFRLYFSDSSGTSLNLSALSARAYLAVFGF